MSEIIYKDEFWKIKAAALLVNFGELSLRTDRLINWKAVNKEKELVKDKYNS